MKLTTFEDKSEVSTATSKFRPIQDIMRDPALKAKLNSSVDEAVNAKLEIKKLQQQIKDLRDLAHGEVNLNPKLFNFYVTAIYNNDYTQRKTNLEEMLDLIETVLAPQNAE